MTPEQFNQRLQQKLANLKKADLIYPAAAEAHRQMVVRIFTEGRMGDNSRIGTYSTKEMWAGKSSFKNTGSFQPVGKVRSGTKSVKQGTQFRTTKQYILKEGSAKPVLVKQKTATLGNGKQRKTMYLPQGYKQFKQIQGYESGFVNLTYSGDLRNDLATKLTVEGEAVVAKVSRKINQDKISGLTKKYGDTLFKHTDKERADYVAAVGRQLTDILVRP